MELQGGQEVNISLQPLCGSACAQCAVVYRHTTCYARVGFPTVQCKLNFVQIGIEHMVYVSILSICVCMCKCVCMSVYMYTYRTVISHQKHRK